MANAVEALLDACENHADEVGTLTFVNNQTGKHGTLFLRYGRIYAGELEDYVTPIVNRLKSTDRVDSHSDLHAAVKAAGGEGALILPYMLMQRQIVDNDVMKDITKDYFLAIVSEILAWEDVRSVWKKKIEITDYPVPDIEGGRLIEVIARRNANVQNMLSMFSVTLEELLNKVVIAPLENVDISHLTIEEHAIIGMSANNPTVMTVVNTVGLTTFSALRYIYRMWDIEVIDLYLNGKNLRTPLVEEEEELLLEMPTDISEGVTTADEDENERVRGLRPAQAYDPLNVGNIEEYSYVPSDDDQGEEMTDENQTDSEGYQLSDGASTSPTDTSTFFDSLGVSEEASSQPSLAANDDAVDLPDVSPSLGYSGDDDEYEAEQGHEEASVGASDQYDSIFAQVEELLEQVRTAISRAEGQIVGVESSRADISFKIGEIEQARRELDQEEEELQQEATLLDSRIDELNATVSSLRSRFAQIAATLNR